MLINSTSKGHPSLLFNSFKGDLDRSVRLKKQQKAFDGIIKTCSPSLMMIQYQKKEAEIEASVTILLLQCKRVLKQLLIGKVILGIGAVHGVDEEGFPRRLDAHRFPKSSKGTSNKVGSKARLLAGDLQAST